jgi:hypothetical protein
MEKSFELILFVTAVASRWEVFLAGGNFSCVCRPVPEIRRVDYASVAGLRAVHWVTTCRIAESMSSGGAGLDK